MLSTEPWLGIVWSADALATGPEPSAFESRSSRVRGHIQLNESNQRRMIQRYSRPGWLDMARGLHALCSRRGRGVGGGACDPTLQANEGEAAGADQGAPDIAEDLCTVADSRGHRRRLRVRWRRGSHARLSGLGRERSQLLPDEGAARGGTRLR